MPDETNSQEPNANQMPRPSGSIEGTPDVVGQPGVESALGRDRSQGELPRAAGFNRQTGDLDLSQIVPPEGAVSGSRVTEEGDPTGPLDEPDRA